MRNDYNTICDEHDLRLLYSTGCWGIYKKVEYLSRKDNNLILTKLIIRLFYLANRCVHSAASWSCLALSARYKWAMPGTIGLSAMTKLFTLSQKKTKSLADNFTFQHFQKVLARSQDGYCFPFFHVINCFFWVWICQGFHLCEHDEIPLKISGGNFTHLPNQ